MNDNMWSEVERILYHRTGGTTIGSCSSVLLLSCKTIFMEAPSQFLHGAIRAFGDWKVTRCLVLQSPNQKTRHCNIFHASTTPYGFVNISVTTKYNPEMSPSMHLGDPAGEQSITLCRVTTNLLGTLSCAGMCVVPSIGSRRSLARLSFRPAHQTRLGCGSVIRDLTDAAGLLDRLRRPPYQTPQDLMRQPGPFILSTGGHRRNGIDHDESWSDKGWIGPSYESTLRGRPVVLKSFRKRTSTSFPSF